jgi:hypothetical protein
MEFTIRLTGTAPLLMHNSRLANPLDPAAKALKKATGKRGVTKTDDDHAEIARLQFLGGLYYDADIGPYLPSDNIWRMLYDSAKKSKQGPRIKEAVFFPENVNPLSYPGPRDPDKLWADEGFRLICSVKIGMSRVMGCRPQFREWTAEAEGLLDSAILDLEDLRRIADTAGSLVGIGDWRPRFGRFDAKVSAR